MYILFVCLFTYHISIISWSLKLIGYVMHIIRLVIFFIRLWKMFLNVVFTLIKHLIELGLNPALTVVCLFIYILFVCLFTYLISIISWSLKLEQITPHWLCHAYYKVSNIFY